MPRLWKEAATLILATKSRSGVHVGLKLGQAVSKWTSLQTVNNISINDQNYKILMLKRNKSMRWGDSYVFPGGVVDKADFSTKWLQVFNKQGLTSVSDLRATLGDIGELKPHFLEPSLFSWANENAPSDILPPSLAFRLTAIRETFEECGILIARSNDVPINGQYQLPVVPDAKKWQELVQNDASQMVDLCLELNCCPDIWALSEWSSWLTPSYLKSRFATIFYICSLDEKSSISYSKTEVTNHLWVSPLQLLAMSDKQLLLPPPQLYELSRLLNFPDLDDLTRFAKRRQRHGLLTYYPIHAGIQDGFVHLLPGDDLYPKDPNFASDECTDCQDLTFQEMEQNVGGRLHRFMLGPENVWKIICNIELEDGHKKIVQLQSRLTAQL